MTKRVTHIMDANFVTTCYVSIADERRTISVAVTRKKKMAVDAIRNVAEGKFG